MPVLWSGMYSRIWEDSENVEGWLADWEVENGKDEPGYCDHARHFSLSGA
jgi:hypothetical protein